MFKIALLYSGEPRHVKECHTNHIETFWKANPNTQIDVFAHIWYSHDMNGKYFWNEYKNRGHYEIDVGNFILTTLQPKKLIFQKPKTFLVKNIISDSRFPHPINNILSMFYSIDKVNKLKKEYEKINNFQYNCVVRLRTDEYFQSNIGQLSEYNLNSINVLNEYAHVEHGLNDHFAFGSSDIMDKYLDVYKNINELNDLGAEINPECLIGFNAQKKYKLPITKNNWKYLLWRDKK